MKLLFQLFFIAALVVGCAAQPVSSPTPIGTSGSPVATSQMTMPAEGARTLIPPKPRWEDDFLIAYIKYVEDLQYSSGNELYIIDSRGGHQINIFEGFSGIRAWGFSWSPTGEWLLFGEYDRISEEVDTNYQSLISIYGWCVRMEHSAIN